MNREKMERFVEALTDRYTLDDLLAELDESGFFEHIHDTLIDFFEEHPVVAFKLAAEIEYDLE